MPDQFNIYISVYSFSIPLFSLFYLVLHFYRFPFQLLLMEDVKISNIRNLSPFYCHLLLALFTLSVIQICHMKKMFKNFLYVMCNCISFSFDFFFLFPSIQELFPLVLIICILILLSPCVKFY